MLKKAVLAIAVVGLVVLAFLGLVIVVNATIGA